MARSLHFWLIVTLLGGPVLGCGATADKRGSHRIAVIPKGTTHDFWRSIHAGAVAAARERGGIEILWEGPPSEDKRHEQQQIVERFTSEGVSAIILAPCDRQTLVAPVEDALERGIPVAIIDSGLEASDRVQRNPKYLGYIATDNRAGGVLAARRMVDVVGTREHPKVMMLRYQAGSQSTEQREAGFRDTIRSAAAVDFFEAADEAGATVDSAQQVAERLLSDHADLAGIFAPNESSTVGVLRALEVLQRVGKVKLVGFDSSAIVIQALAANKLSGLVLQDPFDMGYQAVHRAADFLEGKALPQDRTRHTNLQLVTRENMDDPAVRKLYSRDLRPFLGE
jgi:ribose transport system substrate-binding protein